MRHPPLPHTYVVSFSVLAFALTLATLTRAHATHRGATFFEDVTPLAPSRALLGLLGRAEGSGVEERQLAASLADGSGEAGGVEGSGVEGSGEAGGVEGSGVEGSGRGTEAQSTDGRGEGSAGDGSGEAQASAQEPPIPGLVPIPTEEERRAALENLPEIVDEAPAVQRLSIRSTQADGGCRVRTNRALMARGIERREPVGTRGPFFADGYPTILYLDTLNTSGRRERLVAQWVHEASGTVYRNSVVAGASHRWRTWVERALPLRELGAWTVEVLDEDRCLVASLQFELEAPSW
jgi:hypothetical protein